MQTIEVKKHNANVNIYVYECELGYLRVNISHTEERYRYYAELSVSGGSPMSLIFDVVDTEQENHGDLIITFPEHFSVKYYTQSAIMHTRDKETDYFAFIPIKRGKLMETEVKEYCSFEDMIA